MGARRRARRQLPAMLAAALCLAPAGCGTESAREPPPSERPEGPSRPASERRAERTPAEALPRLSVHDTTGGRVRLPDLAPRDRPLLVWFWAPH